MAEKTIALRDVSKIKHDPVMLALRDYHNAVKKEGEIFSFFERMVKSNKPFKANVLHRGATLSKMEIAQYLEGYAKEMRECKYYHTYVEFLGKMTRPFISSYGDAMKKPIITNLMCYFSYGSLFMWYNKAGKFCRYIFVPTIDKDGDMVECDLLLDAELYNYQSILPPAVWNYDEIVENSSSTAQDTIEENKIKKCWEGDKKNGL